VRISFSRRSLVHTLSYIVKLGAFQVKMSVILPVGHEPPDLMGTRNSLTVSGIEECSILHVFTFGVDKIPFSTPNFMALWTMQSGAWNFYWIFLINRSFSFPCTVIPLSSECHYLHKRLNFRSFFTLRFGTFSCSSCLVETANVWTWSFNQEAAWHRSV